MRDCRKGSAAALRIALVWDSTAMRSQVVLNGVCRRAEAEPKVSIRRFDVSAGNFARTVLRPLVAWQPHGVIVRMETGAELSRLRQRLPGVPVVSAGRTPAGLADTMVLGSATEVTRMARDHFLSRGARTVAFWAAGTASEADVLIRLFRQVVPDGPAAAHHLSAQELRAEPKGKVARELEAWLRGLPVPAGVLTFSSDAAPYLSRLCQKAGLRVPQQVQLIGCDDADVCLQCTPHLTTVIPSGDLIGEAAMEAMLDHLTPGSRPPSERRIEGCTLLARGSTGPVAAHSRSITRASALIQSQATKGLTATKLARMSRQGRSTFYQKFRETTGTTPGRQLRQRRIEAACRLLASSDASISLVAEQCGFSSANYFAQVFRRETGLAPGEYRRQKRSN